MIRKASSADAFKIAEILSETGSPWSEECVAESILNENHTVLVYGESVDGVLIFSDVCGECEILNFAVKKEKRRRGIGESLILELLKNAECVYLDVRKSNEAAIAFYKKHGFEVSGMRKNFYDNPKEDALLMVYKKDRV